MNQTKLDDFLEQINVPYVGFVENIDREKIIELCKSKNINCIVIDGKSINHKEVLLTFLADQLDFPDYFGHNWDALVDCLSDTLNDGFRTCLLFINPQPFMDANFGGFLIFMDIISWLSNEENYYTEIGVKPFEKKRSVLKLIIDCPVAEFEEKLAVAKKSLDIREIDTPYRVLSA